MELDLSKLPQEFYLSPLFSQSLVSHFGVSSFSPWPISTVLGKMQLLNPLLLLTYRNLKTKNINYISLFSEDYGSMLSSMLCVNLSLPVPSVSGTSPEDRTNTVPSNDLSGEDSDIILDLLLLEPLSLLLSNSFE